MVMIFFVLTLCAQKGSRPDLRKGNATILNLDSSWQRIIFGQIYNAWKPSKEDILVSENLLSECFNREKSLGHFSGNRFLINYTRQYFGFIDNKGNKIVWINCFIRNDASKDNTWKTFPTVVDDGGDCFFNLKVDTGKRQYYDLQINGHV